MGIRNLTQDIILVELPSEASQRADELKQVTTTAAPLISTGNDSRVLSRGKSLRATHLTSQEEVQCDGYL